MAVEVVRNGEANLPLVKDDWEEVLESDCETGERRAAEVEIDEEVEANEPP